MHKNIYIIGTSMCNLNMLVMNIHNIFARSVVSKTSIYWHLGDILFLQIYTKLFFMGQYKFNKDQLNVTVSFCLNISTINNS